MRILDDGSDDDNEDEELPELIDYLGNETDSDDEDEEEVAVSFDNEMRILDDDSNDEDEDEELPELIEVPARTTRSGRVIRAKRYDEYQYYTSEANYYAAMCQSLDLDDSEGESVDNIKEQEYAMVGAGIGGGFQNTNELKVMKYREVMATADEEEKKGWQDAIDLEYSKMMQYKVFEPVKRSEIDPNAKVITTTWEIKKKANGTKRARINGRGYEQEAGVHYDPDNIASPVTNDMSIRIMMVLALMASWISWITDVKGAFLHGEFEENDEPVYMEIPEGFEKNIMQGREIKSVI